MIYPPKTLINPTNREVEVMVGGRIFIFAPGEIKHMDGFEAHNILLEINNCPLKEYEGNEEVQVEGELDIDNMAWKEMVKLGSRMKVYRPPMGKEELKTALKEKLNEQD